MRFLAFALLAVATVTATPIFEEAPIASIFSVRSELIKKVKTICEPDKIVPDDCNSCICSHDGKSMFCTQKACSTNTTNNDTSLSSDKPEYIKMCDPGTFPMDECNRCYCTDDGLTASCDFGVCLPKITTNSSLASVENSTKMCKPGEIYKSDCIQCECASDGRTVNCIPDSCIPAAMRNFTSEIIKGPIMFCQPGKSHQDECNDCTCSADGTAASCTLKHCPAKTHLRKTRTINGPTCDLGHTFQRSCQTCTCVNYGMMCPTSCSNGDHPQYTVNGFPWRIIETARRNIIFFYEIPSVNYVVIRYGKPVYLPEPPPREYPYGRPYPQLPVHSTEPPSTEPPSTRAPEYGYKRPGRIGSVVCCEVTYEDYKFFLSSSWREATIASLNRI